MTKVAKARGRRPSDVALTREQIVTAALDILTVKGIEAFSVRDLAKVLGVSESNAGTLLHRTMQRLRTACHA